MPTTPTENLTAAKRVGGAIEAYFRLIANFPRSGRAQDVPRVRKGVIQPWGYLVYYRVDEDAVVVLTVQHPARARPYSDE